MYCIERDRGSADDRREIRNRNTPPDVVDSHEMRQNDERRQEEHNLPQQAQADGNRRLADGLEVVERQDIDGD